jgi:hypothetical protein
MNRDTNCGVGMYKDSPEDKIIERLEFANKELRKENFDLKEKIKYAYIIASETYDTDLARCEAMVRALDGQFDMGGD